MTCGMDQNDRSGRSLAEILDERKALLEQEIDDLEISARTASAGIGFGKRIGEGTSIAVERLTEVARHRRLQLELEQVEHARSKLEAGDTGRCETCGKQIAMLRLEALPWATQCVDCAD